MIQAHVIPDDVAKVTPAYMRTVINRVPEVKAAGRMSIKREQDDSGIIHYVIRLNTNVRRKVLTDNDVSALESKWRAKFIRELLSRPPRITDLEGDELKGAAIAIERFCSMLESMKEGE